MTQAQLVVLVSLGTWTILYIWRRLSPASFRKLAPEVQHGLSTALGMGIGLAFPELGPVLGAAAGAFAKLGHDALADSPRVPYGGPGKGTP